MGLGAGAKSGSLGKSAKNDKGAKAGKDAKGDAKAKAIEQGVSAIGSPVMGKVVGKLARTQLGQKATGAATKLLAVGIVLSLFAMTLPVFAVYAMFVRDTSVAVGYDNGLAVSAGTGDGMPPALVGIYGPSAARYGVPWEIVASLAQEQTGFGMKANDGQQRGAADIIPSVSPPIPSTDTPAESSTTAPPPSTTVAPDDATPISEPDWNPLLGLIGDTDAGNYLGPFLISKDAGIGLDEANDQAAASGAIASWLSDSMRRLGGATGQAVDVVTMKPYWAQALDTLPVQNAGPSDGQGGSAWANKIVDRAASWQAGRPGSCASGTDDVSLPTSGPMVVGSPLGGNKGNLTEEELRNAVLITHGAVAVGANRKATAIALMTAITESSLINDPRQLDHDSVGLFQQRANWGSFEDRMNPATATRLFLTGPNGHGGLFGVAGWEQMEPGEAAQAVQGSAVPGAYSQYFPAAVGLYDTIMGSSTGAPSPSPVGVTPVTGAAPVATPGGLYVIGDSLTVGAQQNGFAPPGATVDATSGLHTDQGIEKVQAADLDKVGTVMVALGTNDASASKAQFTASIDKMMKAIGTGKTVIWVNVDAGQSALGAAAEGVNPALTAAAASNPNLIVADWNAYISAQPNAATLRADDGIHYTPDGFKLRTQWLNSVLSGTGQSATDDCGTDTGGSGTAGGGCDGQLLASALAAASAKAQIAIKAGCSLIGLPYLWGGGHSLPEIQNPKPPGLDCSGFTAWAWYRAGFNIIGVTGYQQDSLGLRKVASIDQARPGDLIFSNPDGAGVPGHTGMYLGNGKWINSPQTGDVVKVADVPKNITGIRRVA